MRVLNAAKAQSITTREVEPVTIVIDKPVPKNPDWKLADYRRYYKEEADAICDVLLTSLPGGIVDQLLAEMMRRKASALSVPFGGVK